MRKKYGDVNNTPWQISKQPTYYKTYHCPILSTRKH